ncbi:DUF6502 family protein [Ramlibacter sp. PS3R-8]|uniref:DUF6502 family protein n=1 Tax=Ramlibacter sp. PS3R-8 TaxID=3133437 RepID=UPI0030AD0C92
MTQRDAPFPPDTAVTAASAGHSPGEQRALLRACRAVLAPLARLAVGHGLTFSAVTEVLKQGFVQAARAAHPGAAAHRAVSRISTTTGLNRREVTRLMQRADGDVPVAPSPATQAFTRWLTDPAFRGADGAPMALRVQGPAPSFESLANSITRDVHPRTLLEELSRLGLARADTEGSVRLLHNAFVPRADRERMLAFLGANVGDHLAAAVSNVLDDGRRHFEQALFADELSAESMAQAKVLITEQWQGLLHTLAPALQALIDADKAAGRPADQRLRIGLFAFTEAMHPAEAMAPPSPTQSPSKES